MCCWRDTAVLGARRDEEEPRFHEGSHCIFALLKRPQPLSSRCVCRTPPRPVSEPSACPSTSDCDWNARRVCEGLAAWLRVPQSTISMSSALCHTQSGYYSGAASKRFRKGQRPMVAVRGSSQFEEVEALRCTLRDADGVQHARGNHAPTRHPNRAAGMCAWITATACILAHRATRRPAAHRMLLRPVHPNRRRKGG